MDVEFCTGEPGGDVEVVAAFTTDALPPLAAGDRVETGDARYTLIDADWKLGRTGFEAVRFYMDKASETPGGLGQ